MIGSQESVLCLDHERNKLKIFEGPTDMLGETEHAQFAGSRDETMSRLLASCLPVRTMEEGDYEDETFVPSGSAMNYDNYHSMYLALLPKQYHHNGKP